MQDLHTAAETLAQPRVLRDRHRGDAGLLQGLGRALRRDELETEVPQSARELDETLLFGHAEEGPAGGNHPDYRVTMERSGLNLRSGPAARFKRGPRRARAWGRVPLPSRAAARCPPTPRA